MLISSSRVKNSANGNCIAREIPSDDELPMLFLGKVKEQPEETETQVAAFRWKQREVAITEAIKRQRPSEYCSILWVYA